ncbi:hypothetical protein DFH06DRAFT_1447514 [Mycena polygramma]|nr:hypothetical protein DFH06DRAFT_1447514 [Mycena polygramma]
MSQTVEDTMHNSNHTGLTEDQIDEACVEEMLLSGEISDDCTYPADSDSDSDEMSTTNSLEESSTTDGTCTSPASSDETPIALGSSLEESCTTDGTSNSCTTNVEDPSLDFSTLDEEEIMWVIFRRTRPRCSSFGVAGRVSEQMCAVQLMHAGDKIVKAYLKMGNLSPKILSSCRLFLRATVNVNDEEVRPLAKIIREIIKGTDCATIERYVHKTWDEYSEKDEEYYLVQLRDAASQDDRNPHRTY